MAPDADTIATIVRFWPSLIGATFVACVHLLVPRFRFMRKPDNPWLPASAGVAIAYVFMDVFPHLAKAHEKLGRTTESHIYGFLTHNLYLVGLAGFAIYLGIILLVMTFREDQTASEITFNSAPAPIKVECASLAAYNFLIGYLLSEQITHRPEPVILFGLAMTIHFVGVDGLMRGHFPNLYDRPMRFIFAASVYAGWVAGAVVEISDGTLALWYSFLAGGIIVIATVYELPQIRSRRQFGSFLAGTITFSALVLAMDYFGQ